MVLALCSVKTDSGRLCGRNFQPNIVMKTIPSTPVAGKAFTIQFSMQRPNRSGSSHGPQNGGRHWSGSNGQPGNWTGGQNGSAPMQPTMSALVTGNSVNQTITLSRQNGVIEGELPFNDQERIKSPLPWIWDKERFNTSLPCR